MISCRWIQDLTSFCHFSITSFFTLVSLLNLRFPSIFICVFPLAFYFLSSYFPFGHAFFVIYLYLWYHLPCNSFFQSSSPPQYQFLQFLKLAVFFRLIDKMFSGFVQVLVAYRYDKQYSCPTHGRQREHFPRLYRELPNLTLWDVFLIGFCLMATKS